MIRLLNVSIILFFISSCSSQETLFRKISSTENCHEIIKSFWTDESLDEMDSLVNNSRNKKISELGDILQKQSKKLQESLLRSDTSDEWEQNYEETFKTAKNKLIAEGFSVETKMHLSPYSDGTMQARKILKILSGPGSEKSDGIYKSISNTLKSSQEKLGIEFYYDPILSVNGRYNKSENIIFLSYRNFIHSSTELNSTILHEIKHANFKNELELEKPGFYYGQIFSESGNIQVKGYEKYLSLEELATNTTQLAQTRKKIEVTFDGDVIERPPLKNVYGVNPAKAYDLLSIRLKSIAHEIIDTSDEAISTFKVKGKSEFSKQTPISVTIQMNPSPQQATGYRAVRGVLNSIAAPFAVSESFGSHYLCLGF